MSKPYAQTQQYKLKKGVLSSHCLACILGHSVELLQSGRRVHFSKDRAGFHFCGDENWKRMNPDYRMPELEKSTVQ